MTLASLPSTSSHHVTPSALLHQLIFVGSIVTDSPTIAKYSYLGGSWVTATVSSIPTITHLANLEFLGGFLYACGTDEANAQNTMLTKKYDPTIDSWTGAATMSTARDATTFGLVALGGYLYACGGYTAGSYIRNVDKYDPVADTWTTRAPMLSDRANFGAAAMNGCIYVVGSISGHGWGGHTSTMEKYDPVGNQWRQQWPR